MKNGRTLQAALDKPDTSRARACAYCLRKFHLTVEELKAIVTKQQAMNAQQQQQIEALTATVQKVSNQLELNKAAQRVVASNQ